jgi:hypothetical protein
VRRKIFDARLSFPGLDLWVLATTTSVNHTDLEAYRQAGEENGIAVEVSDAANSKDGPSTLALFGRCGGKQEHHVVLPGTGSPAR